MAEDYENLIRGSMMGRLIAVDAIVCEYDAVGGKSAHSPLLDMRAAEEIRTYYGEWTGIGIRRHSEADLRALALRRRAMAASRSPVASVAWMLLSVLRSPCLYWGLWRARRIRRQRPNVAVTQGGVRGPYA